MLLKSLILGTAMSNMKDTVLKLANNQDFRLLGKKSTKMKAAIHFQTTGSLSSESLLKNVVTHSAFLSRKAGSINFSLL